jgi:hypothetical protein
VARAADVPQLAEWRSARGGASARGMRGEERGGVSVGTAGARAAAQRAWQKILAPFAWIAAVTGFQASTCAWSGRVSSAAQPHGICFMRVLRVNAALRAPAPPCARPACRGSRGPSRTRATPRRS